jgi:hypothetical protein
MLSDTGNNCSWAVERVGAPSCPLGNGYPLLWSSHSAGTTPPPLTSAHRCGPHDNDVPPQHPSATSTTAIMGVPFEALLPYAIMTGVRLW